MVTQELIVLVVVRKCVSLLLRDIMYYFLKTYPLTTFLLIFLISFYIFCVQYIFRYSVACRRTALSF